MFLSLRATRLIVFLRVKSCFFQSEKSCFFQLPPQPRSFNLGYPNAYERARGRTGNALMVHGNCVSIGCYAMTDERIEEIYSLCDAALQNGQRFFRVHCFPFRMTEANMKRHSRSKWITEWQNLKTGYDWFEQHKRPPNVAVQKTKYIFSVSK